MGVYKLFSRNASDADKKIYISVTKTFLISVQQGLKYRDASPTFHIHTTNFRIIIILD